MKLSIKADEEKKCTYLTYVVDWSDPNAKDMINKIVSVTCVEESEEI